MAIVKPTGVKLSVWRAMREDQRRSVALWWDKKQASIDAAAAGKKRAGGDIEGARRTSVKQQAPRALSVAVEVQRMLSIYGGSAASGKQYG